MEDNSSQDKSEQPTPHKLQRSREKGIVARGVDLGFLAGLSALLGYAWVAGPSLSSAVRRAAHDAFVTGPELPDSGAALLGAAALMLAPVVRPMLLLFSLVFLLVLLLEMVQTGVVFSMEPLKRISAASTPPAGSSGSSRSGC